jgi:hypothetical protein
MNILTDIAQSARFEDGIVVVSMKSGAQLSFPIAGNRRLTRGTPDQLNNIEISPFGLHWPDLDEDLSLHGIARGDHGQA